jgi:hypothetical protein
LGCAPRHGEGRRQLISTAQAFAQQEGRANAFSKTLFFLFASTFRLLILFRRRRRAQCLERRRLHRRRELQLDRVVVPQAQVVQDLPNKRRVRRELQCDAWGVLLEPWAEQEKGVAAAAAKRRRRRRRRRRASSSPSARPRYWRRIFSGGRSRMTTIGSEPSIVSPAPRGGCMASAARHAHAARKGEAVLGAR